MANDKAPTKRNRYCSRRWISWLTGNRFPIIPRSIAKNMQNEVMLRYIHAEVLCLAVATIQKEIIIEVSAKNAPRTSEMKIQSIMFSSRIFSTLIPVFNLKDLLLAQGNEITRHYLRPSKELFEFDCQSIIRDPWPCLVSL